MKNHEGVRSLRLKPTSLIKLCSPLAKKRYSDIELSKKSRGQVIDSLVNASYLDLYDILTMPYP